MDTIRWGFVGPGRIAAGAAENLPLSDGGVLHAVASRSLDRAQAFAATHGASVAYGSYGALLDDPDVDAVYISTPHRQHHAIALATIGAGKHVLVEKAFTTTVAGALEVAQAARSAGVFCMEAMWTRFQPAIVRLRELLDAGAIGDIRAVRADLGLRAPFDPRDRLWDPAQGGGALLDLGVYPVSFVQSILGGPAGAERADDGPAGGPGSRGAPAAGTGAARTAAGTVDIVGAVADNGVDAEATLLWHAGEGRTGIAQCSLRSPLPGVAGVFGTDGWIEVPPRFHHPSEIRLHPIGGDGRAAAPRTITAPATGAGYVHEFDEVQRCVAAGLTESPTMPLDDTIAVMRIVEQGLHTLGIRYDEAAVPL